MIYRGVSFGVLRGRLTEDRRCRIDEDLLFYHFSGPMNNPPCTESHTEGDISVGELIEMLKRRIDNILGKP